MHTTRRVCRWHAQAPWALAYSRLCADVASCRVANRTGIVAAACIAALVALTVYAWEAIRARVPDRFDPFAPLDVQQPPNFLTRWKLTRASADPQACLTALARTGYVYTELEDRSTGPACGFSNAVRIERTGVEVSAPFSFSCRSALSLALWERHVMQPAARGILDGEVAKLEHFGSYACRNVNGRETGRRSAHATADALDVAGFVLADGRRIRVIGDHAVGTPVASFMERVRAGACRSFDVVLGPDYNAAHKDHFHFEAGGGYRMCR